LLVFGLLVVVLAAPTLAQTVRTGKTAGTAVDRAIDYQEGGVTGGIRKLAGVTRFANIRLTRAFTGDRSLYDWHASIEKPQPVKVNGRITMFDRQGTRVASWTFTNGFPVKWEGPDFDASKNELAIETIEIAHEGLTMSEDEKEDEKK